MSDRYSSRFRNFTCRDLRPMKNGEWLAYFLAVAEAPREPLFHRGARRREPIGRPVDGLMPLPRDASAAGARMSCDTAQTTFSGEVERSSDGKSWRYVGTGS